MPTPKISDNEMPLLWGQLIVALVGIYRSLVGLQVLVILLLASLGQETPAEMPLQVFVVALLE